MNIVVNDTTLEIGDQPVSNLTVQVAPDGAMEIQVMYVEPVGTIIGDLTVHGIVRAQGFDQQDGA